jgi:sulfoxide reductase heme-binding subunit YedZ
LKDPQFAKLVVFINSLLPGALLAWDAYNHNIGPDPINHSINTLGMTALVFIMLTLSITPLRKITGWNWLSHFRRMLGLFAFFYVSAHFLVYFSFDRSFSLSRLFADTFTRRFIQFGMVALLAMIPLAATSTNGIIKRMGAARWKRLHRLIYWSALAGVLHFYERVKIDERLPLTFAAVLAVLLAYRWADSLRKQRVKPALARPPADLAK